MRNVSMSIQKDLKVWVSAVLNVFNDLVNYLDGNRQTNVIRLDFSEALDKYAYNIDTYTLFRHGM